jgi:hypothetical protein
MTALKFDVPYFYKFWNFPCMTLLFCLHKHYTEISRKLRSKLKTCKQLDLFLISYLHWWCNIINNKIILMNKIIYHIYYKCITLFIAILFIFPLMIKTDMFHITWAHEMIPIIVNRYALSRTHVVLSCFLIWRYNDVTLPNSW